MLLLLLLLLHHAFARDDTKPSQHMIKKMHSCPDVGYFFEKVPSVNAVEHGLCYLCFCSDDKTASCWLRDNRRCDAQHYQHITKRDTRVRRSPLAFSDVFFRDAARGLFNKQVPKNCKPNEGSYSVGCPPEDWCIGCTICDCDPNGYWDCRVLSYCPEPKRKTKKAKKVEHRVPYKTRVARRRNMERMGDLFHLTATMIIPTNKTLETPVKKIVKRQESNGTEKLEKQTTKPVSNPLETSTKKPKVILTGKPKTVTRTKKLFRRKSKTTTKAVPAVVTTVKPMTVTPRPKLNHNDTSVKIAKKVFRKFMTVLHKAMTAATQKHVDEMRGTKTINKRCAWSKNDSNDKFVTVPLISNYIQENAGTFRKRKQTQRKKREIIVGSVSNSVPVAEKDNPLKFPIEMTKTTLNQLVTNKTKSNYSKYFYTLDSGNNQITTNKNIQIFSAHDDGKKTVLKLIENEKPRSKITSIRDINQHKDKLVPLVENLSNANDLKFKKWFELKTLRNKEERLRLALAKNNIRVTKKAINNIDVIPLHNETIESKKKLKENTEKIIETTPKKYKFPKVVKLFFAKTKNNKNTTNENTIKIHTNGTKAISLQDTLKELFKISGQSNIKEKAKIKKFNVIKYIRKLFNRIVSRKTSLSRRKGMSEFNRQEILNSLCESFGPCNLNLNRKKEIQLKNKINTLNAETYRTLRTINIIKGLLKLVDFAKNDRDLKSPNTSKNKSNFNNEIQKLNAILKGTYANEEGVDKLTETQLAQIDYIKKNTQVFVQSVGKFASVLNEIIRILNKGNDNGRVLNRFSRYAKRNNHIKSNTDKKSTINNPIKKLKTLILKYNLAQNTFLRRLYEVFNKVERKMSNENKERMNVGPSSHRNVNNSAAIEMYAKQIISNLRRLRNLAEKLNSSNRMKREVMDDDDAMEYLLMLMEYLLKQNYHLDTAPVNNGIDLLIEAIKSAPDIKPIQKKVLHYTPIKPNSTKNDESPEFNVTKEENISDASKASKEDNKTKLEDPNFRNNAVQILEENKYNDEQDLKENNTEMNFDNVYYVKDNAERVTTENIFEVQAPVNDNEQNIDKNITTGNIDKLEKEDVGGGGEDDKRTDVFSADTEEDVAAAKSRSNVVTVEPELEAEFEEEEEKNKTEKAILKETGTEHSRTVKMNNYITGDDGSNSDSGGDKKNRMYWIDDVFEEDVKETRSVTVRKDYYISSNESITTSEFTPTISNKPNDNVSSVSKETQPVYDRKSRSKVNVEDIMSKKQMDLLNSLDYGPERADAEDRESKEEQDERYSPDAFGTY